MNEIFDTILSAAFVAAVIRTTTPVLFASLGGLLSDLVGSLNVALEGMMLIGALTAVVVSAYAPWYVGVLAGLAVGGMLGGLMALFHLRFKADVILVGFAVNIIAAGGTVTALNYATGGDKGTSINLPSKAVPSLDLSFLDAIPGIGPVLTQMFSGHSYLTWLAVFLVFAIWYFLYRTPEGLRFRAVGEYPAAAEAAGISPNRLRTYGLVASGALAGLGGAQLAMFNFVGFTRDMTAGRGFIALGAVLLGRRHPVGTAIAAVLFGAFEALSIALPGILPRVPGEVIHTIPFVVTVLALMLSSKRRVTA
ncbi:ABC transporter permease [Kaistia geumhonensis]|uniref:Simple sugar transport system permease protein n=1 Tax=Kaistia geumhonensis TaxID=410839 RepID=A0ABU0M4L7_9HYPH|nr:ABC transporter permease [Kaistia geumhonensis]MCX5478876.1 ABC transporter permease [Kaistia geumhonensis]MDQ0515905.1 simple sugar transport system permease protein [Kaistia geumhonensis]